MREKTLMPLPCHKIATITTSAATSSTSGSAIAPITSLAPPTSNNSIKTAALQSGILTPDNASSAIQSFDDDENEWELGVGNLIIDLDADLEKNDKDPIVPEHSHLSGPGMEHQATVDKGLKMKIKRKKESASSNNSNKHEIVRDKMSSDSKDQNKVSPDTKTNKRTVKKDKGAKDSNKKESLSNGFTHDGAASGQVKSEDPYEFNAKVEDRISVPVKKIKVEKGATPPGSPPAKPAPFSVPEPQPAPSCHVPVGLIAQPPALQGPAVTHGPVTQKDASTETQDSSTITEPECLGPCEPGTSVTLEGIVWQETENGVLVVNVTWRGKTYVGTLLDATRHDWAPPRFNCESPTSESPKGRGVKRNCRGSVSSTPVDNVIETRKLRKGRRGARNFQAPPSPAKSDITPVSSAKRKPRPADLDLSTDDLKNKQRCRSNSRGTPTEPEPKPNAQGYIECPEPNCSKKYKHINGLRYHQSHAHGASETAESKSSNDSSESRPPTPATPSAKDVKRTKSKDKDIKESKKESEKENEADEDKNKNKDKSKKAKGSSDSNQKPGDPNALPKEKKNKHKKKKDREKERSKSPKGAKEDSCNEVKSVISDSSAAVKVPGTPQVGGEGEELAADSVHSPAYSDISDAAETAPAPVETDSAEKPADGKPAEVAATTEPSTSTTPVPTSASFNMYSYYGQPPYLIPTMASKSQQNSPNTTPKPETQTPAEAKADKTREEQKEQKDKETPESVPALYPSSQAHHPPVLTAYGYIEPAYHHHLLSSDPRYRETHEKFLEKQKQAKTGAKKDDKASPGLPVDQNKAKEVSDVKESAKPPEKPREAPEPKAAETRIKTEPYDSLYERHQEDLKRFYMYQQKQQEHKPEDQHSRHEEDRRAVLAIKQEPKSVIEHRPREPEKNTSVIKEPIPASKPDLKRSATPQDKTPVQEKRAKIDRVSPATTPKTSKPSTPTMIPPYGQYAVPPGFIQAPYGQVQLDPHSPYRGVGVVPTLGYPPHPSAYMHPAMRYHHLSPMEKEKQLLMSPGARHPGLPEPPKALDLLQQHASHYYNSTQQQHKIHELEKAARPDTASPPTKPRTDNSPAPISLAKAKDLSMHSGRPVSPPPQRHVHTHHHTHLVGGYPIYDPYGAIINSGQGPSNLPPGAMGHPFPPK